MSSLSRQNANDEIEVYNSFDSSFLEEWVFILERSNAKPAAMVEMGVYLIQIPVKESSEKIKLLKLLTENWETKCYILTMNQAELQRLDSCQLHMLPLLSFICDENVDFFNSRMMSYAFYLVL